MKRYRICCLDDKGHIISSHVVECREDLDALEEAEACCALNSVEVWDVDRLVARVPASNASLTRKDMESL